MRLSRRASVIVVLAALPLLAADDHDRLPPNVAAGLDGVVSIQVHEVVKIPTFHNGRFLSREVEGIGVGSGVVISENGLIVTNAHVVAGSDEVQVGFASGRTAAARLLAVDEASDLALIIVKEHRLRPIPFATGSAPPPGAPAFVIGNRAGRGHEISWARIGKHRQVRVGTRPLEFWAEIDAPVGPGNSGGAVLNTEGELLGIPSLLVQYSDEGVRPVQHSAGLFIPIGHVRRAVEKLLQGPTAVWPWIGLVLDDPMIAAGEGRAWAADAAPQVRRIHPDGPAEEAGFQRGDRIVAIGSRLIRNQFDALDAVLDLEIGSGVPVRIERDGRPGVVGVVVGERPVDPRPDPVDDFMLHTGLRLERRIGDDDRPAELVFAAMTSGARLEMPAIEADLFAQNPVLASILPGRDLLQGKKKRSPVGAPGDLEALIKRCFVMEQFVAMGHWNLGGRRTLDRAHFGRKIYPIVI